MGPLDFTNSPTSISGSSRRQSRADPYPSLAKSIPVHHPLSHRRRYLMGTAARSFTSVMRTALTRLEQSSFRKVVSWRRAAPRVPEVNISPLELQPCLKRDHAWTAIATQANAQQAGGWSSCIAKRSKTAEFAKPLGPAEKEPNDLDLPFSANRSQCRG